MIPSVNTTASAGRPLTRVDVMTAAQVGELLGVPKSTVEDWARRQVIPSRKRGRRRLFLRFEVEEWLVRDDEPSSVR
jgi:excisionase family DNA binding protein